MPALGELRKRLAITMVDFYPFTCCDATHKTKKKYWKIVPFLQHRMWFIHLFIFDRFSVFCLLVTHTHMHWMWCTDMGSNSYGNNNCCIWNSCYHKSMEKKKITSSAIFELSNYWRLLLRVENKPFLFANAMNFILYFFFQIFGNADSRAHCR